LVRHETVLGVRASVESTVARAAQACEVGQLMTAGDAFAE
jgi:hypothetical protein